MFRADENSPNPLQLGTLPQGVLQAFGFLAAILSFVALATSIFVATGKASTVTNIKEVLSSPSWAITDATAKGNTLVEFTITTTQNQPLEVEILGQKVQAQQQTLEVKISGNLTQLFLQDPEMAKTIGDHLMIAQLAKPTNQPE